MCLSTDSQTETLKLEDEINQVLQALRVSQDAEYKLAEELLFAQKKTFSSIWTKRGPVKIFSRNTLVWKLGDKVSPCQTLINFFRCAVFDLSSRIFSKCTCRGTFIHGHAKEHIFRDLVLLVRKFSVNNTKDEIGAIQVTSVPWH
ncbi:hypothetical protein POTOM_030188 [Populus tomentosa]|uniref:DUF7615 domain-containing protein n=1 Tax=Populus tomentosa TaxID=118781 RepID=A0A8X7ZE38_POPTO|nr:hypothetical protein POTOM_030188 [Populus tomentosa]